MASQIEEHMAVVGSDGGHVGTVDKVEDDRIEVTKQDDPGGRAAHQHYPPVSSVAAVQDGEVRPNMDAARARQFATLTGDPGCRPGMGSMGAG